jgi:hypothetical protein
MEKRYKMRIENITEAYTMNLKLNWLAVSLFVFTANLAFAASSYETRTGSNDFSRIIELRNPRMQGDDITSLQNRLLSLGFTDLGEDDGYYGPLTESVIKDIQSFSTFEQDGKIDRPLWDFIFDNRNNGILRSISEIARYDRTRMTQWEGGTRIRYGYTLFVSGNGNPMILELEGGTGDSYFSRTYYFLVFARGFYVLKYYYGNVWNEPEEWVYFALEDNTRIIDGTVDYNSTFDPDNRLMLQIMEEFARTRR